MTNSTVYSKRQATKRVCALLLLLGLVACNQNNQSLEFQSNSGGSTLSMSPPAQLVNRAVVQQALSPTVTINGITVDMVGAGVDELRWTGETVVPPGTQTTMNVLWNEAFGPNQLALASVSRDLGVVNSNTTVVVTDDQYIYDIHDDDNDGFSNLNERINDTNPYDEFDPGAQTAQVLITEIDPADAPTIDGQWDSDIWPSAQFQDTSRARLDIHNLMIDQGATQLDQQPSYRWGAMHDRENLYVIIFTEKVADPQTPFADSVEAYEDDSIDIFVDGNNSKLTSYDGVDDYHFIIPMFLNSALTPNSTNNPAVRVEAGFNALPLPDGLEFTSCICDIPIIGEYTMELSIPLAEVGITIGQPFGFEIQYNDDLDGGTRDAKWGWFHPSRTAIGPDIDFTWEQPKFMGTVELVDGSAAADSP